MDDLPPVYPYGSILLPDSEEKSIGEYLVTFRNGRPYQIRRKNGVITQTLYFIAWDSLEERELRETASEIFEETIAALDDDAMVEPRSIQVVRGDLTAGRQLLRQLGIISDLNKIVLEISRMISIINDLFSGMTSKDAKIFNEDMRAITEILEPCRTDEDYSRKIGALALLFEVKLDPLRKHVRSPDPAWKSIKLIETWLGEKNLGYDPSILETWRYISDLRNATFPYHRGDSRIVTIINFLDMISRRSTAIFGRAFC